MGNNLLQGRVPHSLIQPPNLKVIDGSRNSFVGVIPSGFGKLANLRMLKLYQNSFSGNIPEDIFNCTLIEVLLLQSNRLVGSIPVEVANLKNATTISMSYNLLRGTIPLEFGKLKKLELLHFHSNQVTGIAPEVTFLKKRLNSYISDCGDPSYKLPAPLMCDSCTMCCNSNYECQDSHPRMLSIRTLAISTVVSYLIITIIFYLANLKKLRKISFQILVDNRDPCTIYDDQSAYCFIHSRDSCAMILYALCMGLQIFVFLVYLRASIFEIKYTDWLFHYQCLNNSTECIVYKSANIYGWIPFFIITTLYLGEDFSKGMLQLRKGANLKDIELLFSGFLLYFITLLALSTSYRYNMALATKNTDLITNVLILLFVNELDEKLVDLLHSIFPAWTDRILNQVKDKMAEKATHNTFPLSVVPVESNFSKRQRHELELLHVPCDSYRFIKQNVK